MTTLGNRPNTALLVIDVQSAVVDDAHERDTVVANIATVVEKARAAEIPVVWIQHSSDHLEQGSEQWRIVPELSPDESEPLVQKRYPDSFEETTLVSVLAGLAVGRLVVVGAQTDECVRSTLHGALVRGYDATPVSDAFHSHRASSTRRSALDLSRSSRRRPAGLPERSGNDAPMTCQAIAGWVSRSR